MTANQLLHSNHPIERMTFARMGEMPPPAEVREDSILFGSARLKERVVAAAIDGEITVDEAAELFLEYGLRSA